MTEISPRPFADDTSETRVSKSVETFDRPVVRGRADDAVGAVRVPFRAVRPVVPGDSVTRYFVVPDIRVSIDG